jgi:NADH dehydrogenase FAD-containing subunit
MGDQVARIVTADLSGKQRPVFRSFDKGDMAAIGWMAAVAKVKWPLKSHMIGFPGWLTWVRKTYAHRLYTPILLITRDRNDALSHRCPVSSIAFS